MERSNLKSLTFWLLLSFCLVNYRAFADSRFDQVIVTNSQSIGTTSIPNSLAALDVVSTTKGVLPPRMTTTQMNAISSPPEALSIYNTTVHSPEFYNGSGWIQQFVTPMTTLGDIIYENSTPAAARLAGNTTSTKNFLVQTGTGSASAAPSWGTISAGDVPTLNQNTSGTAANVTASSNTTLTSLSNLVTVGTISTGTWQGTSVAPANGGTGLSSPTAHGVLLGEGSSNVTPLVGGAGKILQGAASADPTFTATPTLGVNASTAGTLALATSTGSGQSVVLQNLGTTTTWNFNLPTTAGSAGQFLTSQAGTSTSMTWTSGLSNPMTTGGDVIYGGASGVPTRLANGSSGQVLTSAGTTLAPTWTSVLTNPMSAVADLIIGGTSGAASRLANGTTGQVLMATTSSAETWQTIPGNGTILKAPTIQSFTATGSTAGYMFTVSGLSAGVAAGCVYTNNTHSFTVLTSVISSATQIWASGASAPGAGAQTLTYSSGGGVACNGGTGTNISSSANVAYSTYTLPTGPSPIALIVHAVGGGGGGGSAGTSGNNAGVTGTLSAFGSGLIIANGGAGGSIAGSNPSAGGTTSVTGPTTIRAFSGAGGGPSGGNNTAAIGLIGGMGGGPGAGAGGAGNSNGQSATANSGSGGGGAGCSSGTSNFMGGGGAGGGDATALITSPASTYAIIVGTGGAGGTDATNGGAGSAGVVTVEERYQ